MGNGFSEDLTLSTGGRAIAGNGFTQESPPPPGEGEGAGGRGGYGG